MSQKRPLNSSDVLASLVRPRSMNERVYVDTDPQMLFALWSMDEGDDPEASLEELDGAVVVYDKFASRVSNR